MNLSLTEEQRLLKDSFARLFAKESSIARVRAAAPLGFDTALWSALVESGAPLARVPEAAGGLDLSLLDAAIVAEEAGRMLASAPLVEVMVAARALAAAGEGGASWIEAIAQGAVVVPALPGPRGGAPRLIPGAAIADAVLTLEGDDLVLVSGLRKGEAAPNVGQMPIAALTLDRNETTRSVLARGNEAKRIMEMAAAEWKLLSASMLGGMARQALDLAAAYARERVQFGRPIGTFQGLAHPLADAVTDVDGGQLFIWKAIWATAKEEPEAAALISLAWWWMGQAAAVALRRSVRTLGGYGLSLEYDLQLYNRRGNAMILLGGDPQRELERAGALLHGGASAQLPQGGDVGIDFAMDETGARHADRLQAFFKDNWTDKLNAKAHHSTKSHNPDFHRKLARAGLIFGNWPPEHGGRNATASEDFVLADVFEQWNYTSHVITITNMVAQIVMHAGTEAAKAEILPLVKTGDAVCSLGFSEPSSGSDVFAARTSAVRDGDDWIINGQKMFTTAGHYADYVLLLARTNSTGPKHHGLTLFIVPTKVPGYSFQAVETYQDERTNITFYADLRLPDRYRLGPVDEGAKVMAAALTIEHGGGTASYFSGQMRMLRNALGWAEAADETGTRPLDDPSIRARFAKIRARYEVSSCHVTRAIWGANVGQFHRAWGPMAKLFITESFMQSCWEILEMSGAEGVATGTHPLGMVELDHRRAYGTTIYGGTSEIHRSIVAEQILGLPKSRS